MYNYSIYSILPLCSNVHVHDRFCSAASSGYFNDDILTFKGHGNLLPDGSRTGAPIGHPRRAAEV